MAFRGSPVTPRTRTPDTDELLRVIEGAEVQATLAAEAKRRALRSVGPLTRDVLTSHAEQVRKRTRQAIAAGTLEPDWPALADAGEAE